jgi:DNA-directed RNA polymerase specialized sigma24 family protein
LVEKGYEPVTDDPREATNKFDQKKDMTLLIRRLPKKYAGIVLMRFVQDLSIDEIATATKQTKNAVAVQIHRGINKLKGMVAMREDGSLVEKFA